MSLIFATEDDLRDSFVECGRAEIWGSRTSKGRVRTITESRCSEGRADWVWAHIDCDWPNGIPSDWSGLMRQSSSSRLIASLGARSARDQLSLCQRLGVAPQTFRRCASELLNAKMIEERDCGGYVLGRKFRFPKIEICSFEFKLENWRRALNQAKRYRAFSHRVYVVMPSDRIHRAKPWVELFRTFNIGLIAHNADGTSKRVVTSRKREPNSSPHFIQALGLLLA